MPNKVAVVIDNNTSANEKQGPMDPTQFYLDVSDGLVKTSLSGSVTALSSSVTALSSSVTALSSSVDTFYNQYTTFSGSVNTSLNNKVSKTGDTMTGPLIVNSNTIITGSATITGSVTTQTQLDFDAVADPSAPLTVALAGVAGNVNVGLHYYFVSFITALGETAFWTQTLAPVTTTAGNQQVLISNIPVSPDPRVTARRIYRTGAGQPYYADVRILTTINNNTQTTFTDNIADASRTGAANYFYRENTTCRYITKDGVAASFIGGNCTSFGQGALATLNAGTHTGGTNTCIGRNAGYILSTGDQNIIISNNSTPITTGGSNVLIHGNWGNNPNACVIIGRNAGAQNSGTNNVALGYAAGSTNHNNGVSVGLNTNFNVTGQGNVAVGTQAGYYSATAAGAFNINIGSGVRSAAFGSSGQINIGNVIYGVNAYQSTTPSSTPTTTGRVGLGLETPTARLHLPAGTTAASSAPLKLTAGVNMTVVENGAFEYDGTDLWFTTGGVRKKVSLI